MLPGARPFSLRMHLLGDGAFVSFFSLLAGGMELGFLAWGALLSAIATAVILSVDYLRAGVPARGRNAARTLAVVAAILLVDYEARPRNCGRATSESSRAIPPESSSPVGV